MDSITTRGEGLGSILAFKVFYRKNRANMSIPVVKLGSCDPKSIHMSEARGSLVSISE